MTVLPRRFKAAEGRNFLDLAHLWEKEALLFHVKYKNKPEQKAEPISKTLAGDMVVWIRLKHESNDCS